MTLDVNIYPGVAVAASHSLSDDKTRRKDKTLEIKTASLFYFYLKNCQGC